MCYFSRAGLDYNVIKYIESHRKGNALFDICINQILKHKSIYIGVFDYRPARIPYIIIYTICLIYVIFLVINQHHNNIIIILYSGKEHLLLMYFLKIFIEIVKLQAHNKRFHQ